MAIIYRTTDRLKVEVDDITFVISPLSFEQKSAISSAIMEGGTEGAMKGARLAIKFAVKNVEGLQNSDGSTYKVIVDDGQKLDDSTVDDLFNLSQSTRLSQLCLNLISGVPEKFIDPSSGAPLEGVRLVKEKKNRRPKS